MNGFIKVDQAGTHRSVFKHITNSSNVSGNATTLSYPGMHPSDIIFVQKGLPYIGTGVIVWYDYPISAWKIATENVSNMPTNVEFNVMVIKTQ